MCLSPKLWEIRRSIDSSLPCEQPVNLQAVHRVTGGKFFNTPHQQWRRADSMLLLNRIIVLILEMVVAIAAFVSLGVIPVARQMLLQRRYPGSSPPGFGTPIAHVSPPGFFGIAVSDPPVQLQYSPISVWDQPKATPTPATRPHPPISQAPSANPSHSTPAATSRSQPAMALARAISDLTEWPLASSRVSYHVFPIDCPDAAFRLCVFPASRWACSVTPIRRLRPS